MALSSLASAMADLLQDEETADYTLSCRETTIKVHSQVLSARSPFFKAALATAMTEQKTMSMKFNDTGIAPEVLIDAVNFMYGLDLSVGLTNCAGLLDIAERFVMDDLKREASKHFAEGLKLNKDNYLELSHMADRYNAKELLEKCAKYIMLEGKEDDIDWEEVSKLSNLMLESMKVAKKGGNFLEDDLKTVVCTAQASPNVCKKCNYSSNQFNCRSCSRNPVCDCCETVRKMKQKVGHC